MPVRIRYKIEVSISSTSAEEKDLGNAKFEVVNDEQGEGGSWKTLLAAGAVNVPIPLNNVATARLLVVRTTAKDPTLPPNEVRLRRNLITAEEIAVKPLGTAKEGLLVLTTDGLTAVFASNPGTVAMDVIIMAVGD